MNQLTLEQKKIVANQDKILLVNAYAGTGKTSTLVEYCKARKNKNILYLAYNSSMAKEAVKKFEGLNVKCLTIHSLAYQNIGIAYKDRLEKNASLKPFHLSKYFKNPNYEKNSALMDLFYKFLTSNKTIKEITRESKGEVDTEISDRLSVLWNDILYNNSMPFEHDFYLKMYQLAFPKLSYDYILVDEAQDLNPVMFDIIVRQSANLVFIGDSYQKIYGFRRCINALELLASNPKSKTLYLSETFRCPTRIISLADPYLKLAGAKIPLVSNKKSEEKMFSPKKQKCIICRTNAKIFCFAYENQGKKIHFVGGIKNYKLDEMVDLMLVFSKNEEIKKNIRNPFYKNFKSASDIIEYANNSKDVETKSRINVLLRLLNANMNPFEFVRDIKDYPLKDADYIITSAHKSKGLEWDHVVLEDDFLDIEEELLRGELLKKSEKNNYISIEEINLLYVAITRAKVSLESSKNYFFDEEIFKEAKKILKFVN
ncbi:UvrD-helicase domain-containing protein [Helicobacter sp. 13S00482-2]|uniref:UvrD-helicase domain-containing protein n=1 Tax=Helicobacter sp. 13S00482-2 TaxID=1476200 RepID=UPI000BA55E18|nr:UvrD-helicase domain-containing protein [Helicobacter sp. 13S00482-2]